MTVTYADNFNARNYRNPGGTAVDNFNLSSDAAATPDSPTGFGATPLNGAAYLSWSLPAPKPGAALTGLKIYAEGDGVIYVYAMAETSEAILLGLTNDVLYTFSLVTVAGGYESSAVTATATPSGAAALPPDPSPIAHLPNAKAPAAPQIDSAAPGDTQIRVTWSPGDPNGAPIENFTLTVTSTTDSVTLIALGTDTSIDVLGLTNSEVHTLTLTATNSVGTSLPSNVVTATPLAGLPSFDTPPPPPPLPAPNLFAFYPDGTNSSNGVFSPSNWAGL